MEIQKWKVADGKLSQHARRFENTLKMTIRTHGRPWLCGR